MTMVWEDAIEREDAKDWQDVVVAGLSERLSREGEELTRQQGFARIEAVISDDRRTVGLVVCLTEGPWYQSDSEDVVTVWLSRPDAQRLGMALLKQAPGIRAGDESVMLLVPMG